MAVGVIVAALSVAVLIAHGDHRNTLPRGQRKRQFTSSESTLVRFPFRLALSNGSLTVDEYWLLDRERIKLVRGHLSVL